MPRETCCREPDAARLATGVDLALLLDTGVGPLVLSRAAWARIKTRLLTAARRVLRRLADRDLAGGHRSHLVDHSAVRAGGSGNRRRHQSRPLRRAGPRPAHRAGVRPAREGREGRGRVDGLHAAVRQRSPRAGESPEQRRLPGADRGRFRSRSSPTTSPTCRACASTFGRKAPSWTASSVRARWGARASRSTTCRARRARCSPASWTCRAANAGRRRAARGFPTPASSTSVSGSGTTVSPPAAPPRVVDVGTSALLTHADCSAGRQVAGGLTRADVEATEDCARARSD